ncbi:MAG: class I SAM-dependent methyltransferase [Chloroflexota bacterium]|nr:class I SAM-dependent methyltransferase [Chloroflexota bacterium]
MKWWEKTPSILSGDYENIYGLNDDVTKSEVEFLINVASIPPQSNILDLCCGTGRHSMRLAELGYKVTGLDISSDFLKIAVEKSLRLGLSINWINKDMRDIPFENKFDLVFIMFGAWGFFEEDHENYAVFKAVNQALKMDGHFILDFFNRDWILRHFQPAHWVERKTGYYLEKRQFDNYKGRLNTESVFIKRDGAVIKWKTSLRAFTYQEIISVLKQEGFSIFNVYGDLERRTYDLNTPRMLLHAIKGNPNEQ